MTRVSPDQFSLLLGNQRRAAAGEPILREPVLRKPRKELPENILKDQALDFLRMKGWTPQRNQVGTYVPYREVMLVAEAAARHGLDNLKAAIAGLLHPIRIGEEGIPDWFVRRGRECWYLELKAPGKKPSIEQQEWIRKANATGTLAVWFDNIDTLIAWYAKTFEATR